MLKLGSIVENTRPGDFLGNRYQLRKEPSNPPYGAIRIDRPEVGWSFHPTLADMLESIAQDISNGDLKEIE